MLEPSETLPVVKGWRPCERPTASPRMQPVRLIMRATDMMPYDQLNLIAILWLLILPVALFVLTVVDAG